MAGVFFVSGACSKSTEAPVATTVVVTPGGAINLPSISATQQLTAKVHDQHGDTMPGVGVTWSSNNTAAATVSATGLVTAIGNGSATITATAGTIHTDISCSVAQVAVSLTKVAGDGQIGPVGTQLPTALDVRVTDALGFPVTGVAVTFSATAGNGSLTVTTGNTNASGDLTTQWTLGTVSGLRQITATSGSLPTATFTSTAVPGTASLMTLNAGNNQTWLVGGAVPVKPSVKVTDQYGNGVAGGQVTFAVTGGGGSITGSSKFSDGAGVATVGSWTLGSAGTNTLSATAGGFAAVVNFTATATLAGAPKTMATIAGGATQTALVGYATNVRPAVQVLDANGLPVASITVTFAPTAGGGSVTGGSVSTNANGIAQVGNWTVGAAPGANTLQASIISGGVTGNPATFSANGINSSFNIVIQNFGPPVAPAVQVAFDSAVARWQRVIIQDLPDVNFGGATAGQCGPIAVPAQLVDDVVIRMKFDSIDGPSKILGQAGPCFIRSGGDNRTIVGLMSFDSADVALMVSQGILNAVIEHEMGHVLGFGTLWGSTLFGCLQNPSSTGSALDTYFSCPKASVMFDSIGGTSYTGGAKVPVENCAGISGCGAGTYNSHWRESTFFNELMTGYVNGSAPGGNPMSTLTIAAMEDEGYTVNYAAAETYTRTFTTQSATGSTRMSLGDDILRIPIQVLDPAGRLVRVIQR